MVHRLGLNVVQLNAPAVCCTASCSAIAADLAVFAVVSMPTQRAIVKPGTQRVAQADINRHSPRRPSPRPPRRRPLRPRLRPSPLRPPPLRATARWRRLTTAPGQRLGAHRILRRPPSMVPSRRLRPPRRQGNGSVATASAAARGSTARSPLHPPPPRRARASRWRSAAAMAAFRSVANSARPRRAIGPASFYVAALSGSATLELSLPASIRRPALFPCRGSAATSPSPSKSGSCRLAAPPVAVGFLAGANGSFPLPADLAIEPRKSPSRSIAAGSAGFGPLAGRLSCEAPRTGMKQGRRLAAAFCIGGECSDLSYDQAIRFPSRLKTFFRRRNLLVSPA